MKTPHNKEGQKEGTKTIEEAHDTEDGYCCACGYDIAVFQGRISDARSSLLESLIEEVRGMKIHVIDAIDYNYNEAISDIITLLEKRKV